MKESELEMAGAELLSQGYRKYRGQELDIYYNVSLCAHAGECVRGDSKIFEVGRKPWILPDNGGTVEHTMTVINRCPSGALKYLRHEKKEENV
ncbi:(4Fe-4S)-binding protein [Lactococcus nasutitermitis]|uniref:(4Fe-4S)-binding protein n=1 Tax=Lactococcus nasutitermitis TaxID=1652957 RepID=A0ABV9JCQ3_9LACT|nr:(4Fe-4S)-binding protein [Lactococcus nasutitermitis]